MDTDLKLFSLNCKSIQVCFYRGFQIWFGAAIFFVLLLASVLFCFLLPTKGAAPGNGHKPQLEMFFERVLARRFGKNMPLPGMVWRVLRTVDVAPRRVACRMLATVG